MERRLRSPPEMPRFRALPMTVSAARCSPSVSTSSSTRRFFSESDTLAGNRKRAANSSVSRTVICV